MGLIYEEVIFPMSNPFTLSFGKEPTEFISRLSQTAEILDDFSSLNPASQVYMITGVRGSGKTVMLTMIKKELEKNKEWIVVELSPVRDMLKSLAAKLYEQPALHRLFMKASLDLTKLGIGVSIRKTVPVEDIETALGRMLREIQKSGRRVLITVDESLSNQYVCEFASIFQILLREDYPVYLLMTGLYENIYELQNEEGLTFLYRAPKITLDALSINAIRDKYQKIFRINEDDALKMANLTMGYPFAFQVLGYLGWKKKGVPVEDLLPEYDQYLEEYVYSKIWSELSAKDQKVLLTMALLVKGLPEGTAVKNASIRKEIGMSSAEMSVYRGRLIRKGIIAESGYGQLAFCLPRFAKVIRGWNKDNMDQEFYVCSYDDLIISESRDLSEEQKKRLLDYVRGLREMEE